MENSRDIPRRNAKKQDQPSGLSPAFFMGGDMAKLNLSEAPKNFPVPVKFPLLSGEEAEIECSFIYRSRTEFAEFLAAVTEAAGADFAAVESKNAGDELRDAALMIVAKSSEYLGQIMDGWNLDMPFNDESLKILADRFPAAVRAIMAKYRQAIEEGRLGN
jgi:hypothetical protein